MDKGTFIKRIAFLNRKTQPTQELYNKVLNDLINGIKTELAAGRKVYFQGLGTFYTRTHKGGKARNFKTGKPVQYKDVRVAAFRPGSVLKEAVRKR